MFWKGNLYAPYLMNLLVGITFMIFVGKLFSFTLLFGEQLVLLVRKLIQLFKPKETRQVPGRRKFVRNTALGVASIPLFTGIFGLIIGKYLYKVNSISLNFNRLPKSFDGLKVVQFTDFHAGSFDWDNKVQEGLQMINDLKPDLILFTGDLVNNRLDEALPYLDMLKDLKAKHGKFAILGNHDYGDYIQWDSEEEKQKNLDGFEEFYRNAGFKLLKNHFEKIEINGESIVVAGVENWGSGRFPKHGDLDQTFKEKDPNLFTLLLSHDPDHWKEKIRAHEQHVDLTLSGHTHGAQFGVPIPGGLWSPVSWRYDFWKGLYTHTSGEQLYVNTGFGFLGYPGRINMPPEITEITLRTASA
jgi:predicted MPP superfamily phosphohydrolase